MDSFASIEIKLDKGQGSFEAKFKVKFTFRCDDYAIRYYCAGDINGRFRNSSISLSPNASSCSDGWTAPLQMMTDSMSLVDIIAAYDEQVMTSYTV